MPKARQTDEQIAASLESILQEFPFASVVEQCSNEGGAGSEGISQELASLISGPSTCSLFDNLNLWIAMGKKKGGSPAQMEHNVSKRSNQASILTPRFAITALNRLLLL
jgi:hypothetical protein